MRTGKLLVAQGGGPTAVINQSLAGIVLAARTQPGISQIYGAQHGVRGIIDQNLVNLGHLSEPALEKIAITPGAALGSTRDKPDAAYCQEILKILKAHTITHIAYIGGNDSSDTLRILAEKADLTGYPLRCVHVPKTIDNDLVKNDHTPGFGSAARYVASVFAGIEQDNRALPGVYIGIVMGRHAGFLTAASTALRQRKQEAPHLIYCPERAFEIDSFLSDVRTILSQNGRCVIAVSEGITDTQGQAITMRLAQHVEHDPHGNPQLSGSGALGDMLAKTIREKLGVKRVRADTLGYPQRCFPECLSITDAREARKAGEEAIRLSAHYARNGSLTLNRSGKPGDPYKLLYALVPLRMVAGKTRTMPLSFLNRTRPDVSAKFLDYITPLIGPKPVKMTPLGARPVPPLPLT